MDLATLRAAGEAIFGERWQMPMARALGALHPEGARESIDIRAVQRWVAGARPVPAWITPGIVAEVARAERERHTAHADRLRVLEESLASAR